MLIWTTDERAPAEAAESWAAGGTARPREAGDSGGRGVRADCTMQDPPRTCPPAAGGGESTGLAGTAREGDTAGAGSGSSWGDVEGSVPITSDRVTDGETEARRHRSISTCATGSVIRSSLNQMVTQQAIARFYLLVLGSGFDSSSRGDVLLQEATQKCAAGVHATTRSMCWVCFVSLFCHRVFYSGRHNSTLLPQETTPVPPSNGRNARTGLSFRPFKGAGCPWMRV